MEGSGSKAKKRLRVLVAAGLSLICAYACAGPSFEAVGSGAEGGQAGSGSETPVACRDASDCDDESPCTADQCGGDGTCQNLSLCDAGELCCEAGCGRCCGDEDCNDELDCTVDHCLAGSCSHVPDDGRCAPDQYCSIANGCQLREPCSETMAPAEICDDGHACTTDQCDAGFCSHVFCAGTDRCCPDLGCRQCCTDLECNDGDPCTVDQCGEDGACLHLPKCGDGSVCCPNGSCAIGCCSAENCDDGKPCTSDLCLVGGRCENPVSCELGETCNEAGNCAPPPECSTQDDCDNDDPCLEASCSDGLCVISNACTEPGSVCCKEQGCGVECCTDLECNDQIACTVDRCTADGCRYTPDSTRCTSTNQNAVCDAELGCVGCTAPAQCNDENPCTIDRCENNRCTHSPGGCGVGKLCCPGTNGNICAECCGNIDCSNLAPPPQMGQPACSYAVCSNGQCTTRTETCDLLETCCPDGCSVLCSF